MGDDHFHTGTHEVLGAARGPAKARFGGRSGKIVKIRAPDVITQLAGTDERHFSRFKDLLVMGAYPKAGRYDEPQPFEVDHPRAVPASDPVCARRKATFKWIWRR
jgi:uncharacterized protein YjlB